MLILTRKLGQSITIGDEIKVTVLDIHGRQVRLGITAPQKVTVHREEIYQRIQEENIKAAKADAGDLEQIKEMVGGMRQIKQDRVKRNEPQGKAQNGGFQKNGEVKTGNPVVDKNNRGKTSNP